MKNFKLYLILIIVISIIVPIFSIFIIVPNALEPIYENDIYSMLQRNNRNFLEEDVVDNIAQIYITDEIVKISSNFSEVTDSDWNDLISVFEDKSGKVVVGDETLYYSRIKMFNVTRITFTNNEYIIISNKKIVSMLLPIFFLSILSIITITYFFNKKNIDSFKSLNEKIINIDNNKFDHTIKFNSDDEIGKTEKIIEKIRIELKEKEKYKQDLFQNISHDLKTPIMVIKSYTEAIEDGTLDKEAIDVIKKQSNILEDKVFKILHLNKIEYYNSSNENFKKVNINKIIEDSVSKYKEINKDINFTVILDNSEFYGREDLYEIIIDNILENFLRYAKSEIKISLKNNRLILFNDGKNIDKKIINTIFKPYEKGSDGKFGLGLAIVKNTLDLFGYNIEAKNLDKGVEFVIFK